MSFQQPSQKEDSCIFCQIVRGTSPAHKVWEDDTHLGFLSIYPNTRGLTVVIPKKHSDSYIFNNTDTDVHALMRAAQIVSGRLVDKFSTVERVAVVFEGYGVDHLHAKLFPLHGTSGPWKAIRSEMSTRYDQYPGYISSHDAARESDEVLAELAEYIRK